MNMADVEWTNESVVRLIDEYKKRRELWDKNHDMYRVQTAKYEAWNAIARIFDCDIADLRKKFNSILASHRREKAKIRGGGRSSWFLYPYLSFLSNHLEQPGDDIIYTDMNLVHRKRKRHHDSSIQETLIHEPVEEEDPSSEEQEPEAEFLGSDFEDEIIVKQEPPPEYVRTKRLPPLKNSKRLTRTVKRRFVREIPKSSSQSVTKNQNIDSKLIEMLKLLKKSSEIAKKKDECDSFGDYIAISLRKHDEKTQCMIKQAINNILFEQEMKKYSAPPYTMVITDENPLTLGDAEVAVS